ncbi:MAG TPA: 2-oxo-4-hydroxy-4-carboxy-5-ureidoimidazoline decarboxylase [Rhodocyclaceae bacterium]|nr:2-oxo-4-hydroxy-4-carboxy-5-ureidoimidazoline decarboxylase [Rhodocyclaceae bacterium]
MSTDMSIAHPTATRLQALSAADRAAFAARLGGIFEHSPWIAERAWAARPFESVAALHRAMLAVLETASPDEQLGVIRAHPELAGKEAAAGTLTADSTSEQRGAGLDRCSADELAKLRRLNAAYHERFGFPFVMAVKGRSKFEIMDALDARLGNDRDTEFRTCLAEIGKIARFRLDAMFAD